MVGTIITLVHPLDLASIQRLIDIPHVRIDGRLDYLHAVIDVPTDDSPIRLFHLSFRDFLIKSEGANEFWIDEKPMHRTLATKCIHLLDTHLCEDMYKADSLTITALEDTKKFFTPELQ